MPLPSTLNTEEPEDKSCNSYTELPVDQFVAETRLTESILVGVVADELNTVMPVPPIATKAPEV
jgi:hypothetical protein